MGRDHEACRAMTLLRAGRSDEEVERLTGLDLLRLIELRAYLATAPGTPRPTGWGRSSACPQA